MFGLFLPILMAIILSVVLNDCFATDEEEEEDDAIYLFFTADSSTNTPGFLLKVTRQTHP